MSGNKPFNKTRENDEDFIHHIVNEMDEIVYVCDPLTYDLLYRAKSVSKSCTSCRNRVPSAKTNIWQ